MSCSLFLALYPSMSIVYSFFFFFSSRRRHTRLVSDWSSDVCSSDLLWMQRHAVRHPQRYGPTHQGGNGGGLRYMTARERSGKRSEERRVGEEGGSRGGPGH